jgi:hypothetical protein
LGRTFNTAPTGRVRPKTDRQSRKAIKDRIETETKGIDKTSYLNAIYAFLKTLPKPLPPKP